MCGAVRGHVQSQGSGRAVSSIRIANLPHGRKLSSHLVIRVGIVFVFFFLLLGTSSFCSEAMKLLLPDSPKRKYHEGRLRISLLQIAPINRQVDSKNVISKHGELKTVQPVEIVPDLHLGPKKARRFRDKEATRSSKPCDTASRSDFSV